MSYPCAFSYIRYFNYLLHNAVRISSYTRHDVVLKCYHSIINLNYNCVLVIANLLIILYLVFLKFDIRLPIEECIIVMV